MGRGEQNESSFADIQRVLPVITRRRMYVRSMTMIAANPRRLIDNPFAAANRKERDLYAQREKRSRPHNLVIYSQQIRPIYCLFIYIYFAVLSSLRIVIRASTTLSVRHKLLTRLVVRHSGDPLPSDSRNCYT